MPIGRYVIYKCDKCGYKTVVFQGDVILPVFCPKCNHQMKPVDNKIYILISFLMDLILRR